jgi:hypothetical protein
MRPDHVLFHRASRSFLAAGGLAAAALLLGPFFWAALPGEGGAELRWLLMGAGLGLALLCLGSALVSAARGLALHYRWGPASLAAEQMLERAADAIRDAVLDWGAEEPDGRAEAVVPLPPLAPEALLQAVAPQVEQTLRSTAEVLNAAPTAQAMTARGAEVCRLFEELLQHTLALSVQLRVDAAVADHQPPPAGDWAERYRRFLAAEGRLPPEGAACKPTEASGTPAP